MNWKACVFLFFAIWLGSQAQETKKVLVCYWGTWAVYKPGDGQFTVDHIPPDLCTHLVYSFAGINNETWTIQLLDPWLDLGPADGGSYDYLRKAVALRDSNPDLKVTIAIGGWSQGSTPYSQMAQDPDKRATFIDSIIDFIAMYDFDGVDMDWEYPARRGGIPQDKQNFPIFLKELREALDKVSRPGKDPLLLTSAFGCGEPIIEDAYDVPEIAKYLDYFHLMLYDFKMYLEDDGSGTVPPGSNLLGHHSPLFSQTWEDEANQTLTVSFAVESFIRRGAPPEKIVMGVGAYGKTYELFNRSMHNVYDEAKGPGAKSEFTVELGTSSYYEICRELLSPSSSWEISVDPGYQVPYAWSDTKWIGYDNEMSAATKVDYAVSKGLAGMMVWSLDFDDFGNNCGNWYPFGITQSLKNRIEHHQKRQTNYL